MQVIIDDNEISFTGNSYELYQSLAKLLVNLEDRGDLPVQKALCFIGLYSEFVKVALNLSQNISQKGEQIERTYHKNNDTDHSQM